MAEMVSLKWLKAERRRQVVALKKLKAPPSAAELARLADLHLAIAAVDAVERE